MRQFLEMSLVIPCWNMILIKEKIEIHLESIILKKSVWCSKFDFLFPTFEESRMVTFFKLLRRTLLIKTISLQESAQSI